MPDGLTKEKILKLKVIDRWDNHIGLAFTDRQDKKKQYIAEYDSFFSVVAGTLEEPYRKLLEDSYRLMEQSMEGDFETRDHYPVEKLYLEIGID
ncbi:MAG: hypothetical protein ACOCXP_02300 [Candidatus Dojkabacteria bacterium]